ncbi:MAG TPA: ABC transporter [Gammaproteobacteria bacterium]|nr:ABC transporter [Gammaproteobacteria bacterium]|tara:strand:+ start:419 stop:2449 length:2031 start_codon:yes stop_codon:yes gene_type:complete
MNTKSLFSSAGLVVIAVALVFAVAIISLLPGWRIDLTEDNLYSLSDGTRNIVASLEHPIELMFFYSDSAIEDLPQIRSYGTRVQELLREIVIASNGRLSMSVIDPEPFSEDEDLATQYGVQAVPVTQGGEAIYFGLVVIQTDADGGGPVVVPVLETMPLIRPDQEQFLEYEFLKLITRVGNPDLPVVGLLTELDIDGGFNPIMGQATPPWMVMDFIRQLYEVRRVDIAADDIDVDIDLLMIVHPQDLSQQMLYAIDQHVMRGGKTLVFLDPSADSMVTRSPQGNLIPAGMSSDLPGLLAAWGIAYASDKVLTDSDLALRVRMGQNQQPEAHLGMLGVHRENLAGDDIITNRLEAINFSSTGAIASAENANTVFEPLIQSSTNAMLMDAGFLEDVSDPSILFDEFVSAQQSFVIAARVSGVIDSAFPDGRPVVEEADVEAVEETDVEDSEVDESDAAEATEADASTGVDEDPGAEREESPVAEHIASSNGEVNIVIFADTDMLSDRLWVQVAQFLGQRIPQPFANNGDIVINTLDNLSGSADLVSIRSRGTYSRPFTRVLNLQRKADDRLRIEESELLDRLTETEAALAELNQTEDGQLISQITPEIQAEIDQFNAELLDTRRRLRDVQFQLSEDIEQLGSRLKAINTGLIPILLTLLLLGASYLRAQGRRTANQNR